MSDLPTVKELEEAALARDWQPYARLADAWVSGRLVDREAIDQSFVEFVVKDEMPTWPQWKIKHVAQRVVDAAIENTPFHTDEQTYIGPPNG